MKFSKKDYDQLEAKYWPENQKDRINKPLTGVLVLTSIIVIFSIGYFCSTIVHTRTLNGYEDKISKVMNILENEWYFADEIDNLEETLIDNALYGMTYSPLDIHTSYLSPEESDLFYTSLDGSIYGIGITFIADADNTITGVYKESPADKAGLKSGDKIIAVDGIDVIGSESIPDLVKGDLGTEVTITVDRDGEVLDFVCTRGQVNSTVLGSMLDESTGYLLITDFGNTTADSARMYLDDMVAQGATALIIDLRQDGGGYLSALQQVASLFIPSNTLVAYTEDTHGNREDLYSLGNNYTQFQKYVILTDNQSASASEAFTLAMKQCLDNVTIVGKTTYGKGTMQDSFALGDGTYVKVTTGKWFSPLGDNINDVGITPDIDVDAHPILTRSIYDFSDSEPSELDTVSEQTKTIQLMLDYIGYSDIRTDGYMDQATLDAYAQFAIENDLSTTISKEGYDELYAKVIVTNALDKSKDRVLQKALEVIHG